jgi:hypothetical protein
MVYVRLERSWTDDAGTTHEAGAMVDVDAGTLAGLQADGTVSESGGNGSGRGGSGGGGASPDNSGWAGPDSGGGSDS